MTITDVDSPENFRETLKTKLKEFMEENKSFNVQGSWTGEDGVTVSVLVDFGIEDRDMGEYYVGTVSARYEDNYDLLEGDMGEKLDELDVTPEKEEELMDDLKQKISESDTFREAENSLIRAVTSVFDIGRRNIRSPVEYSDIDAHMTTPISYGRWETRDSVDFSGNA